MSSRSRVQDKILVVDDDLNFQKVVEGALASTGLDVVCVRSGEDALKLIAEQQPRGIVLDGLLPGLRGDEVAIRIRRQYPKEVVPIVFITAFFRDLKSRAHLTQTCQVDLVLHKPLTAEDFRRAVSRIPNFAPRALPALEPAASDEFELDVASPVEMLAEYVATSQERVVAMRSALASLRGAGRATALKMLRNEAHRFRGSGATFGLPEVSRLGAQMEDLLADKPGDEIRASAVAKLTGLVEALAAKLARSGASAPIATEEDAEHRNLSILLLDGPGELAVSCREEEALGIRVCETLDEALAAVAERAFDVVVIAADRADLAALERLVGAGARVPLVMGADDTLAGRLEAQRRGAQGYVHRVVDAEALVHLAQLFTRRGGARVLALDSSPAVLEELAKTCALQRITIDPCQSPDELLRQLQKGNPSAVVLGESSGLEPLDVLRALRAEVRGRRVPVLALTRIDQPDVRLALLEAGADDVLASSCAPAELAARLRTHASRYLRELAASSTDLLTGLVVRGHFLQLCERALALARRGRSLAILVFHVHGESLAPLAAQEALAAVAVRLRRSFRTSDVLAQVGPSRIAVLLHDISKVDAERLLAAHLGSFGATALGPGLAVGVDGAVASFPEQNLGAAALLAAAEQALASAAPVSASGEGL